MSIVRFTTVCDDCGIRSQEYATFAVCEACGADTCPACVHPGTLKEGDGEGPDHAICRTCAKDKSTLDTVCGGEQ